MAISMVFAVAASLKVGGGRGKGSAVTWMIVRS